MKAACICSSLQKERTNQKAAALVIKAWRRPGGSDVRERAFVSRPIPGPTAKDGNSDPEPGSQWRDVLHEAAEAGGPLQGMCRPSTSPRACGCGAEPQADARETRASDSPRGGRPHGCGTREANEPVETGSGRGQPGAGVSRTCTYASVCRPTHPPQPRPQRGPANILTAMRTSRPTQTLGSTTIPHRRNQGPSHGRLQGWAGEAPEPRARK